MQNKVNQSCRLALFQPRQTKFGFYFVKKSIYDSLMFGFFSGDENSTPPSVSTLALERVCAVKENPVNMIFETKPEGNLQTIDSNLMGTGSI